MIDYMELAKHLGKDTISLAYLELESKYKSGWDKYTLQGVNAIEVWLNPCINKLKIRGSIPYFMQGHNFTSSPALLEQAFLFIQDQLSTYLLDAEIEKLEFGQIIETEQPPQMFFIHHHKFKRSPLTRWEHGLGHKQSGYELKLYDAKKNLKRKTSVATRQELISSGLFSPEKNYLKIESRYTDIQKHLGLNTVQVTDLIDPGFWQYCSEDLTEKYGYISKTGNSKLPMDKKHINSSTLPLLLLAEKGQRFGFDLETELKQLLKSIPSDILNTYDKKARTRQLKQNLDKIKSSELSQYDITYLLKSAKQYGDTPRGVSRTNTE